MDRNKFAMGLGLGLAGAVGAVGAALQVRRRRQSAHERNRQATGQFSGDIRGGGPGAGADLGRDGTSTATGNIAGGGAPGSLVDFGAGTVSVRDAVPTGGAGTAVDGAVRARAASLPPPASGSLRTATRMAPGIPTGSGQGIDRALGQPDSDLGGGVAGDTTVQGGKESKGRDEQSIRNDDAGRTTL